MDSKSDKINKHIFLLNCIYFYYFGFINPIPAHIKIDSSPYIKYLCINIHTHTHQYERFVTNTKDQDDI